MGDLTKLSCSFAVAQYAFLAEVATDSVGASPCGDGGKCLLSEAMDDSTGFTKSCADAAILETRRRRALSSVTYAVEASLELVTAEPPSSLTARVLSSDGAAGPTSLLGLLVEAHQETTGQELVGLSLEVQADTLSAEVVKPSSSA